MDETIDGTARRPFPPSPRTGGARVTLPPNQPHDPADSIHNLQDPQNIVGTLAHDMAAQPPVDISRVEYLRSAVAGNAYPVDAERIADAMVAETSLRQA